MWRWPMRAALGLGLNAFIDVSLKTQSKEALADFERRIADTTV